MANLLKIKFEKGITLIVVKNILYIEASNKHSIIYYNDFKKIKAKHSLKWFESQLSEPTFYRIHDSFIISCHYFESIKNLHVILKGEIKVPISRYKKQLFEVNLEKYYDVLEAFLYTSK